MQGVKGPTWQSGQCPEGCCYQPVAGLSVYEGWGVGDRAWGVLDREMLAFKGPAT